MDDVAMYVDKYTHHLNCKWCIKKYLLTSGFHDFSRVHNLPFPERDKECKFTWRVSKFKPIWLSLENRFTDVFLVKCTCQTSNSMHFKLWFIVYKRSYSTVSMALYICNFYWMKNVRFIRNWIKTKNWLYFKQIGWVFNWVSDDGLLQ